MSDKQPEALRLFSDCKTDQEKSDFFLIGRGYTTGVIAASIQNDVSLAYQRCANAAAELRRLYTVNAALVDALTLARGRMLDMMQQDDGQAYKDARKEWRRLRKHSPQLQEKRNDDNDT